MSRWIIDSYGLVVEEGNQGTYFDYCDSYWRSGLYSIAYNDRDLIEKVSSKLLKTEVRDWKRHPEGKDGFYGTFSRDQLILVLAALKYHRSKQVENYNNILPLYSKLGQIWFITLWFKIWLRRLAKRWSIIDFWFILACFFNGVLYTITRTNGFNCHLWAWMIWSLEDGWFKKAAWLAFNLGGYNIPKWAGVKDNYLYCFMQKQTKMFIPPQTYDVYLWQENDNNPGHEPGPITNTVFLDILKRV